MVKIDFEALMANKSNEDLQKYIDDSARYQEEAVSAAVAELSTRGGLSDKTIDEVIHETEEHRKTATNSNLPTYITTNENAPQLFTKSSIWSYSILTPIFGVVFMFINLEKEKQKSIVPLIILAVITVWLEYINFNFFSILFGPPVVFTTLVLLRIIVPSILTGYFWPKYIGNETMHRKKSTTIPRLIVLAPIALGIIFMIIGFIIAATIA